jgi:hypothetical protein
MKNFDFIEGFNSCEDWESNNEASKLAFRYNLPMFGGSDSHHIDCIGTAFTDLEAPISKESELIGYVLAKRATECGGEYYQGTVKDRIGVFNHILVESFWFYNRFACIYRSHKRKVALSLLTH